MIWESAHSVFESCDIMDNLQPPDLLPEINSYFMGVKEPKNMSEILFQNCKSLF
jgi:hypothetical protein